MIKIENPADCCGCTACASICPRNAIEMQPDILGFLYPAVNNELCINCGLCNDVCAFHSHYDTADNLSEPEIVAARHKNIDEVMKSRSGAMFVALSDYILDNGGIIYGAGYAEHFRVIHKRASTKHERDVFRGSKYVQSDLTGIFRQVKTDLSDGKTVLFSGTPCQTAGLHSYIGKKLRSNLILVDIICHGVPAPNIWQDYLFYLEKINHSRIIAANFRNKAEFGWASHKETYRFLNGKVISEDKFTFLFYEHIMFRHSCGKCHYTNIRRPGDITLGDYWGWERTSSTINADDKGISLVLINTDNGRKLFDKVRHKIDFIPVIGENYMQPALRKPFLDSPYRDAFEKDYADMGFDHILKKYGNTGWRYLGKRILNKVRKFRKLWRPES